MVFNDANWIAVLVSLIIAVVLGTLWYGPLFGKKWMKLMGISQKQVADAKKKGAIKSGMALSYLIMMISTVIMICVLGLFLQMTGTAGTIEGAMIGFWVWLGFMATVSTGQVTWEGKPWSLWLINNGYQLVNMLIIGAILGTWQ